MKMNTCAKKCALYPLGSFQHPYRYGRLSGCYWCDLYAECFRPEIPAGQLNLFGEEENVKQKGSDLQGKSCEAHGS